MDKSAEEFFASLVQDLIEGSHAENDHLRTAVRAFLARYDEIWPEVNGVFALAANHGWTWPAEKNWKVELDALRRAVAEGT